MRDITCDVDDCARGAKLWYGLNEFKWSLLYVKILRFLFFFFFTCHIKINIVNRELAILVSSHCSLKLWTSVLIIIIKLCLVKMSISTFTPMLNKGDYFDKINIAASRTVYVMASPIMSRDGIFNANLYYVGCRLPLWDWDTRVTRHRTRTTLTEMRTIKHVDRWINKVVKKISAH